MKPIFPLFPALLAGFRHLAADWRFLSPLIGLPVLAGFGAMTILSLFHLNDQLLWACVIKLPSDFITGVFLALYSRHILFRETPSQMADDPQAQNHLALSTIFYTTIAFIMSGLAAFSLTYGNQISQMQTQDIPTPLDPKSMGLALVTLAVMIWVQRFQWLPIAAAAGYPIKSFLQFMGWGFALPIRIFALWIFASIPGFLITGMTDEALRLATGATGITDMEWPAVGLAFLVRALASTLTVIITTAGSIHAIRHCMKGREGHV